MVTETPSDSQLRIAREKTEGDLSRKENGTRELRIAARALWLQLNLEYQAYLSKSGKQGREAIANEIQKYYRELSEIIWRVPEVDSKSGKPIAITLSVTQENMAEWGAAKHFIDGIVEDVKGDFPPDVIPAKTIVRRGYFRLISPSRNGDELDPNRQIQIAYEKAFNGLQNLAKEAAAAKVQGTIVMRRFYGQKPNEEYKTFVTTPEESKSKTEKFSLGTERELLFSKDESRRYKIDEMVQEVASGGQDQGVVGSYRQLNVGLDVAAVGAVKASSGTGWNGLLNNFKQDDNSKIFPKIDYPNDLKTSESGLREALRRIDLAYGFRPNPQHVRETDMSVAEPQIAKRDDGSNVTDDVTMVPLRNAMQLLNEKSENLKRNLASWSKLNSPLGSSASGAQGGRRNRLDDLIEYDEADDSPTRAEKYVRGQRSWFADLVIVLESNGADKAGRKKAPTLEFDITWSAESRPNGEFAASLIPLLSIPANAPPTKSDQFIRRLATTELVANQPNEQKEAPTSITSEGEPQLNYSRDEIARRVLARVTQRDGKKLRVFDELKTIWMEIPDLKNLRPDTQEKVYDWVAEQIDKTTTALLLSKPKLTPVQDGASTKPSDGNLK